MQFLKADTTITLRIGPFIDQTDGFTPLTTLAIAQADVQISKGGAAFAQTSTPLPGSPPNAIHDTDGWYSIPLTTTDTNTEGILIVQITITSSMSVWKEYQVVNANVYDALYAPTATDYLQVDSITANVTQINSSTTAAQNLEASSESIILGTTSAAGTTTIFDTDISGTYTTDDGLNGRVLIFRSDTTTTALRGQAQVISSYTSTGGEITLAGPLTTIPSGTDTFVIV